MPFNFELLEDFSFSEKEKAGARRARPRALRRVIALFRPLCAAVLTLGCAQRRGWRW